MLKKRYSSLFLSLGLAFFSGCDSTSTSPDTNSTNTTSNGSSSSTSTVSKGDALQVNVTGFINESYTIKEQGGLEATLGCEDDTLTIVSLYKPGDDIFIQQSFGLNIPLSITQPGTYSVVGSADSERYENKIIYTDYTSTEKSLSNYTKYATGTVTLSSIPTKADEYLTGEVQVSLAHRSDKDKRIEMNAKFNLKTSNLTFTYCDE